MGVVRFLLGVITLLAVLITASPAQASETAPEPSRDQVLTSCCLQSTPLPMDAPRFVAGATTAGSTSVRDASLDSGHTVVSPMMPPVVVTARLTRAAIPRPPVRTVPLLI